jgi:hypothetical protein
MMYPACMNLGPILNSLFTDKPSPRVVNQKRKAKDRKHRKEVRAQKRRAA